MNIRTKLMPMLGLFFLIQSCDLVTNNKTIELNEKGLTYLNNGELEKAKSCFREAIKNPKLREDDKKVIYRNAAIVYSSCQMQDSAKIMFMNAYKSSPKNSYEYYINLGDVYIIEQKYKESYELFNKAYLLDSSKLEANNSLGLMLVGEYDMLHFMPEKALKYNLKAVEISGDRNTKFVLGKNYYYLKDYTKSKQIINELYQKFPNEVMYIESLISIATETNNLAEKNELMNKLKTINPELYNVYLNETIEE